MKQDFHYGNRQRLYRTLPEDTLVLLFSGHAKKKTADEDYPFYADRNFVYLTGLDCEGFVFLAEWRWICIRIRPGTRIRRLFAWRRGYAARPRPRSF